METSIYTYGAKATWLHTKGMSANPAKNKLQSLQSYKNLTSKRESYQDIAVPYPPRPRFTVIFYVVFKIS